MHPPGEVFVVCRQFRDAVLQPAGGLPDSLCLPGECTELLVGIKAEVPDSSPLEEPLPEAEILYPVKKEV